jgi:hypothetical protein
MTAPFQKWRVVLEGDGADLFAGSSHLRMSALAMPLLTEPSNP